MFAAILESWNIDFKVTQKIPVFLNSCSDPSFLSLFKGTFTQSWLTLWYFCANMLQIPMASHFSRKSIADEWFLVFIYQVQTCMLLRTFKLGAAKYTSDHSSWIYAPLWLKSHQYKIRFVCSQDLNASKQEVLVLNQELEGQREIVKELQQELAENHRAIRAEQVSLSSLQSTSAWLGCHLLKSVHFWLSSIFG